MSEWNCEVEAEKSSVQVKLSRMEYFLWRKCSCPFVEGKPFGWWGGTGCRTAGASPGGWAGDDQQCWCSGLTGLLAKRNQKALCHWSSRGSWKLIPVSQRWKEISQCADWQLCASEGVASFWQRWGKELSGVKIQ